MLWTKVCWGLAGKVIYRAKGPRKYQDCEIKDDPPEPAKHQPAGGWHLFPDGF